MFGKAQFLPSWFVSPADQNVGSFEVTTLGLRAWEYEWRAVPSLACRIATAAGTKGHDHLALSLEVGSRDRPLGTL